MPRPRRWGLGPVFVYESLLGARRWQLYAGRAFFVFVLLIGMVVVWLTKDDTIALTGGRAATFQQMAKVGEGFFYALTGIQVSLVLLAAPAAAAGSVCMDRARGTLLHLLVTDLSDAEIVLGKLASRVAPVFGMIACGLPVTALAALLGGIEFPVLFGAFAVSMALGVLGCALALTISVWAAKTHEVLMAVYLLVGLWLLALPIWWSLTHGAGLIPPPDWYQKANPYVIVFAPYNRPGFVNAVDYGVFVGVVLGLSATLAGLSVARLRAVAVGQAGRSEKAGPRRVPGPTVQRLFPTWLGPTLDGNPVLWREWHRNRASRLVRRLWLFLTVVCWALAVWGTYLLVVKGFEQRPNPLPFGFLIQLLFGLLMLSAMAPTTLAEERTRGSLDVLLSTPLSTRSIVLAKWWGVYRLVLLLAILPLYASLLMAATPPDTPSLPARAMLAQPLTPLTIWDRGFALVYSVSDFLASGAVIVSLGLALATWVRRLSRAITISVVVYFVIGIGWPLLVEVVYFRLRPIGPGDWYSKYRWLMQSVSALSPIAGPIQPMDVLLMIPWDGRRWAWIGFGVVVALKATVAGLLLWLTVRTFDRCLGRVPESPSIEADDPEEPAVLEELAASAT